MTYFIAYSITSLGMSTKAILFKILDESRIEMISEPKEIDNVYNDVYFVFIDPIELRSRKSFVRTTLKPIWKDVAVLKSYLDFYFYVFKLLYYKEASSYLSNPITLKQLNNYVKEFMKDTINEYKNKYGILPKDYIISVQTASPLYLPKQISTIFAKMYLVQSIPKEEALKIIQDNEVLVLWEEI